MGGEMKNNPPLNLNQLCNLLLTRRRPLCMCMWPEQGVMKSEHAPPELGPEISVQMHMLMWMLGTDADAEGKADAGYTDADAGF